MDVKNSTQGPDIYTSGKLAEDVFTRAFHFCVPNAGSWWTKVATRTSDKVQIELCQFSWGAFGARDKKESMFHLYCQEEINEYFQVPCLVT